MEFDRDTFLHDTLNMGTSKTTGPRVCLEFANTREELAGHAELFAWARSVWLLGEAEERALFVEGRLHPEAGARVVGRALELRETLCAVLGAVAAGREPDAARLESLGRWVAAGAAHRRLTATPRGVRWRWTAGPAELERVLWPVAQSAADLLTSDDAARLRGCVECGRFFVDATKNSSRRFCGKACGDRVKSRRYYRRLKRGTANP